MLANSILGRFWLELINGIINAWGDSVLSHIWLPIWNFFNEAKAHSFIFNATANVLNAIKRVYFNSLLYRFLKHESVLDRSYKNSFTANVFDRLVKRAITAYKRLYLLFCEYNFGSLNYRIYKKILFINYLNALGVFVIFMCVVPGNMWNNMWGLMAAVIFMAFYFFSVMAGKDYGKSVKALPLPLLLFMVAAVLGVFFSSARNDSLRIFMLFFTSFALCIIIFGSMSNKEKLNKFIGFIFTAVVLTSLYALYQAIIGVEVDLTLTDVVMNEGMPGRVYSTFSNPNNYAEFLILLIPFCAAYALNKKDKVHRFTLCLLLVLPILALATTYSRSCWVSFAISVLVFIILYKPKLLILLFGFVLLSIPFLPDTITNRILTIGNMGDTSNAYRIYIWEAAVKMIRDNFLTGIGLGPAAFSKVYPSYAHVTAVGAPHSHMLYLEVFIETGLLGGLSYLWLHARLIRDSLIRYGKIDNELKNILIAAVASLTGVLFVSSAEYIWFYPRVMFVFFIVVGMTLSAIRLSKEVAQ